MYELLLSGETLKMKSLALLITLFISMASSSLFAAADSKPFAEKKVVLQISDPNPFKQTLVLNVANNLVKHYGPDKIDIEIVAFGPGLRLLLEGNSNTTRINGLANSGVKFAACENTISAFTKALGKKPTLHKNATPVSAGVVRILELTGQGFSLVKP